ncbi:lysis system i-spanin subunit Rz [Orbus sturtevantii]|uniref:lysis system i-spanin subunit Rz n=1 Tax=Orbus sturtevantii TaxID=3074109 RepID=UPI00370D8CF8
MSNRFKLIFASAAVFILLFLGFIWVDIRNTYIELGGIKTELSQIKAEFKRYQLLAQKVRDIDDKFTQELTHAKAENNKLYNNVINGLGRLQFNINKTATTNVDDAKASELSGEARQNYYLLRDDIITKDTMIIALQKYITAICLAN